MGVGDETQRVSQFVLEDDHTFRTWKKHTEIIGACKQLVSDAINWQYQEGVISNEKKSILSESLKVVDLAEQVFGANHAGSRLANEINEWHPISEKINEDIKQACVEHGHGGRWNAPDYHISDVVCIDMKECYPASIRGQGECTSWFNKFGHPTHYLVKVAVNGELPQEDITGFAQVRSFKFASNIHPVIPVWYEKHFACRSGEGCAKNKGWAPIVLLQYLLEVGILENLTIGEAIISLTQQTKVWLPENRDISCAIIGKFTQGGKIDEKRLTHRLVMDEGELDFLIKDCTDAGTFAGECTSWFNKFGHPTHYLVKVAVNGELPQEDITGFAQVRSFKFASNIHPVIPVWYEKHFACRSGEGCAKNKGWAPIVLLQYLLEVGILENLTIGEAIISLTQQTKVWLPENRDISCAIIGKFTQGGKIDEKRLTHRLVMDEGELDFLIKDCTDAGTFAGREKCPLGFILTYYEGHQPQYTHLRASMLAYAHINLLEMLRRFQPNEVVRIATDSIYVRKEALYKIENISAFFNQVEVKSDDAKHRISDSPILCSHYPSCAMCSDPEEFLIPKSEYAKWIKEFQKTKTPLVKYNCKKHNPFVCRFCFGEWFYKLDSFQKQLNRPEEQEGEKIYGPVADIVCWPKNRHWKSIKNISDSIAPSIHDPITRCRKSYLNGGGGSGKKTRAIRIFKNINIVVFTHTNALAKDFRENRDVKTQTWHSFFRWNDVGNWTPERMGEKTFP
ncbi:hypothetical protein Glove_286g31 [Diversispora epigaea]|uniref:Uncharacterized protein n=1 Tax=Diversispora epigaea TaxID=1348612 RepID=A0A397I131_9GLOM|nr:hypothetical protein Glove_286g31 [Diversispora epigaea]